MVNAAAAVKRVAAADAAAAVLLRLSLKAGTQARHAVYITEVLLMTVPSLIHPMIAARLWISSAAQA